MWIWLDETHRECFLFRLSIFGDFSFCLCIFFCFVFTFKATRWNKRTNWWRWSTPLLRVTHSEDYEQYNKREMETGKMLLYSSCLIYIYIFHSIPFLSHLKPIVTNTSFPFYFAPHSMQLFSLFLCQIVTHRRTQRAC